MKSRYGLGALSVVLLASSSAFPGAQEPQQQDLAARVQVLEDEVKDLRQLVTSMVTMQRESADNTKTFFTAQANAVGALRSSLDTVEKEGFTAGINPRSREELLSGWRTYLSTIESAVPGDAKPKDGDKKGKDGK
ncbi:MAG: hypothetical protein R3F34_15065 [Planctomycetota bacterium]